MQELLGLWDCHNGSGGSHNGDRSSIRRHHKWPRPSLRDSGDLYSLPQVAHSMHREVERSVNLKASYTYILLKSAKCTIQMSTSRRVFYLFDTADYNQRISVTDRFIQYCVTDDP